MSSKKLSYYFSYKDNSLERKYLIEDGKSEGERYAASDYPYAVYRERRQVEQFAAQKFQEFAMSMRADAEDGLARGESWSNYVDPEIIGLWDRQLSEIRRLFTSAFIAGYEETIAAKDEAVRPKTPPPQPAATPAASTTEATGTTVKVVRVDRTSDLQNYIYYLQLIDPEYPKPIDLEGLWIERPPSAAKGTLQQTSSSWKPRTSWGKRP